MIIIAENKTNHLMIKQFLSAVKNTKNTNIVESTDKRDQNVGLHKAFDPDELTIHSQDDTVEIKDLESLLRSPNTDVRQQSKARSLISIIEVFTLIPA